MANLNLGVKIEEGIPISKVEAFISKVRDSNDIVLFLKDEDGDYFVGHTADSNRPIVLSIGGYTRSSVKEFLDRECDNFDLIEVINIDNIVINISKK